MSKLGRRFAFVRFIKVCNVDSLISRMNEAWYGTYHLFASVSRFERKTNVEEKRKPNVPVHANVQNRTFVPNDNKKGSYASLFKHQSDVNIMEQEKKKKVVYLEQSDMSSITDEGTILLGKVRELSLIENIQVVCTKEGFHNVDVNYLGGSWVWMDFDNRKACSRFKQHEDMQFYFTKLCPLTKDFVVDDKVVWVRIEGLPIVAWSTRAFKKIAEEWGEVMYVDDEGGAVGNGRICIKTKVGCKVGGELKVMLAGSCYNVWVKELSEWVPKVNKQQEESKGDWDTSVDDNPIESQSMEDQNGVDDCNLQEEEIDSVPPVQNGLVRDDDVPLKEGIEGKDDENKEQQGINNTEMQKGDSEETTPSKPPGFEEKITGQMKDGQENSGKIQGESNEVKKCSFSENSVYNPGEAKTSSNATSLINDMSRFIEIGCALGYDMKGCQASLENLINGIQETRLSKIDMWMVKQLWGNMSFDFATSSAMGLSGGIMSIWDPLVFSCHKIASYQNVLVVHGEWLLDKFKCTIMNVYAPQDIGQKRLLWTFITDYMSDNVGNYILLGDYNAVRVEGERWGCQFSRREATDFNRFIDRARLLEVPMGGYAFTRLSLDGKKMSKLDRFFISEGPFPKKNA
ncbi:RNA-directed DNA polymerase, eukaryota [Artemisia annua]|uniref:RNA-directed DNA polymerase, eukaryota n=1 Tax=Artemisia annua TaxID=35608 RepID=A0A2U1LAU8_ARTAN|nr:RNA-directed DNA polymerase, eukaryota [Artemisia annua]